MKNLKSFAALIMMCAAVMVACEQKPDPTPEPTPTPGPSSEIPEVEPTEGAVTVVWNIVDAEVCSGLVFAGDYNGYNTDPAAMVKFEAIEGYEGWYKAVITPADPAASPVLAGKPCALAQDGTFPGSWDYQWIGTEEHPCEIIEGEAELKVEYEVESQLVVTNNSSVVYVRSYAFKTNPCVEAVYEEVTFNLETTVAVEGDGVIYVVGDAFETAWDPAAYPMEKVDANHWTVTLPALIGKQYKYVVNGSWDNDQMLAPEEGAECSKPAGNINLDFNVTEDKVYGFLNFGVTTKCEDAPAE